MKKLTEKHKKRISESMKKQYENNPEARIKKGLLARRTQEKDSTEKTQARTNTERDKTEED